MSAEHSNSIDRSGGASRSIIVWGNGDDTLSLMPTIEQRLAYLEAEVARLRQCLSCEPQEGQGRLIICPAIMSDQDGEIGACTEEGAVAIYNEPFPDGGDGDGDCTAPDCDPPE